jgi:hypothetical protein
MKAQMEFRIQYLFHPKCINMCRPLLTMYLLSLMKRFRQLSEILFEIIAIDRLLMSLMAGGSRSRYLMNNI